MFFHSSARCARTAPRRIEGRSPLSTAEQPLREVLQGLLLALEQVLRRFVRPFDCQILGGRRSVRQPQSPSLRTCHVQAQLSGPAVHKLWISHPGFVQSKLAWDVRGAGSCCTTPPTTARWLPATAVLAMSSDKTSPLST